VVSQISGDSVFYFHPPRTVPLMYMQDMLADAQTINLHPFVYKRLRPPYDSRCRNYQENLAGEQSHVDCIYRCMQNLSMVFKSGCISKSLYYSTANHFNKDIICQSVSVNKDVSENVKSCVQVTVAKRSTDRRQQFERKLISYNLAYNFGHILQVSTWG